jgi:molybdate transport system substrate-binding protein
MRRRGLVNGSLACTAAYAGGQGLGWMGLGAGLIASYPLASSARAQSLPTPVMQQILVSAASDLKFALADVLNQFQRDTGLPVVATYGSSGQFARQIAQGLPTDLFMSADEALVAQLADKGLTQDKGVVYAIGRLALIVPRALATGVPVEGNWSTVQEALGKALGNLGSAAKPRDANGTNPPNQTASIAKLAIANPEHAPYGRAAKEALTAMGLWHDAQARLVLGENVAQATQFVASGAAQAGFTALSLAIAPEVAAATRHAPVPAHLHAPLRQRMVLLKTARPQTQQLYLYLQTQAVRKQLLSMGFGVA